MSTSSSSSEAPESGFQTQLSRIQLWDLVQMECLSGTTGAFRVSRGAEAGTLFFEGGQLVHAEFAGKEGDAAALKLLAWENGSFNEIPGRSPARRTLTSSWQSLLLRVAQARDEAFREKARPPRPGQGLELVTPPGAPTLSTATDSAGPESSLRARSHFLSPSRSEETAAPTVPGLTAVELHPSGEVLRKRGPHESLEDVAAYAMRLAELIGDTLGLDEASSVSASLGNQKVRVYRGENGTVLAGLAPKAVPLEAFELKLHL